MLPVQDLSDDTGRYVRCPVCNLWAHRGGGHHHFFDDKTGEHVELEDRELTTPGGPINLATQEETDGALTDGDGRAGADGDDG